MHAIKSSARKEAWRNDSYNPFARGGRQTKTRDEEEGGLRHVQTEGSVPSQTERKYGAPGRASTEPNRAAVRNSYEREARHETDISSADTISPEQHMHGGIDHGVRDEKATPRGHDAGTANGHTTGTEVGKPSLKNRLFKKPETKAFNKDKTKGGGSKWKHRPNTILGELRAVIFGSWVNVLLVLVPVSFALDYSHADGKAIFAVSFLAIIPLAATLSYATEELAMYTGETLGGLLNASFGNATELIVSVIALTQQKVLIVQTSLIGSMLSNLLLVLGMCFFFGGVNRERQYFNVTVAQTASSLLALSIGSLIIPTAFVRFGSYSTDATNKVNHDAPHISRGTAVILLMVYACYLFFQLKTHTQMYNEPSKKQPKRKSSGLLKGPAARLGIGHHKRDSNAGLEVEFEMNGTNSKKSDSIEEESDDEAEDPTLSLWGALATLGAATVLIAFCSEFMVTGIGAITEGTGLSQEFVGLILLPIVGNAAEHATAVTVAIKDKMDLAIGVAVGSSMQIALLVLPFMVFLGWCGVGQPGEKMTLVFDGFQVSVLFIAVLLVNYLIQDGESHWLEGILLLATYTIIATTAFYYPAVGELAG